MAESIHIENITLKEYLQKIEVNSNTMYLNCITPSEKKIYREKLPAKTSVGYDNISNNFLKQVKHAIIEPLMHIFNLSLSTDEFPDEMKLSEVSPLF